MAGNCWDLTSSVIVAENGLEKGIPCYAVRGGSWYATKASCALTYRGEGRAPRTGFATVGFRVVAVRTGTLFTFR
jgi:formylglycine-generating enzyme required for sulfatase activity